MSAAALVRKRSPIAESLSRPSGVTFSDDAVLLVAHWLGRYRAQCVRAQGVEPDGLPEFLARLGELCAAESRVRDRDGVDSLNALRLGYDDDGGVVDIRTAAEMLGLRPDSVRRAVRDGRLDAVVRNGRIYPKLASVRAVLEARKEL